MPILPPKAWPGHQVRNSGLTPSGRCGQGTQPHQHDPGSGSLDWPVRAEPSGGADSEDSAPSALGAETPGSGSYSYWCQGPRERVEDAKAILPLPAETEATAGRWHSEEWMGVGEGAGWPGQKRPSLAQGAPLGSGGGPASKGPEEVGGIRPSLHRAPSSGVILWVSPQFSMWNKALWLQQRRPWAPELCPTLSQHAALEGTRTHPDGWHGPGGTHRPCWKVTWLRGTWSCQPPSCTEGPRGQPDAARLPQRVTRRPTSGTPQAHGFPRALAAAGRQPWTDVVISGPALFTPAPPHGRMGLTGMPSTVGCHEEGGAVGTWWGRD